MTQGQMRIRRSILDIQRAFEDNTDTRTLENLMTAWAGIKALPPTDPHSFFILGGYHGEPFRGAGYGNSQWWGGWCNHGNVLFPTWHRIYLVKLEEALQSIAGCEDVMLPYWDQTDADCLAHGIPSCLTDEVFTYSNGKQIPNPLRSYTFPVPIVDNTSADQESGGAGLYSKPIDYTTVRYPYSGLAGSPEDAAASALHNKQWPTPAEGNAVLNQNIVNWLNLAVVAITPDGVNNNTTVPAGIHHAYQQCLDAPNFTVFSNTTSRQHYNDLLAAGEAPAFALEDPHNHIHLATGGADITTVAAQDFDASPIVGANGDMGENDTAGLDPIFYFHHCNVDRMFWVWQKKTGNRDALDIIALYPGTNSVDSQGPTPGVSGNVWLSMDSELRPFIKQGGTAYVAKDAVNIETQLNYSYSIGSLDQPDWPAAASAARETRAAPARRAKVLHVAGVNKGAISGSFLIAAYVQVGGERHLIGVDAVLSRHAIQGCANCQTHLNVKAHFSLAHLSDSLLSDPRITFSAEVIGHKVRAKGAASGPSGPAPGATSAAHKALRVSIR